MTTAVNKGQPVGSRRSFTDEFKADAVALVIVEGRRSLTLPRRSGLVRARWGTGCDNPASTAATRRV